MTRPYITPDLVSRLSRDVSAHAALVWVYLWSRAGKDDARAWPGTKTIAADLEANRTRVLESLKRLEAAGWIEVARAAGARNEYIVTAPIPVVPENGHPQEACTRKRTGGVPVYGQGVSPKTDRHPNTTKNLAKNTTRARGKAAAVVVPKELDSEAFRQAWADWQTYRKQRRQALTPLGQQRALAKLATWGDAKAILALQTAIEKGWQGFYEPREENGKSKFDPVAAGRCPR